MATAMIRTGVHFFAAVVLGAALLLGISATGSLSQPVPVLGYLTNAGAERERIATFRAALAELGYVDGTNIRIEVRGAELNSDYEVLAAELVRIGVNIIVGVNATATNAARKATSTVPIVMTAVNDPIEWGFVDSLERPGRNVTGTTLYAPHMVGERLRILKQLVPSLDQVSMLLVPTNAANPRLYSLLNSEAQMTGIKTQSLEVQVSQDIEPAFGRARAWGAKALLHANDAFINSQRTTIARLAEQSKLPMVYADREYVIAGGLMSLGPGHRQGDREAAKYVDRILRGASPAVLPITPPTQFVLTVRRSKLDALGINLPNDLKARVTEWLD